METEQSMVSGGRVSSSQGTEGRGEARIDREEITRGRVCRVVWQGVRSGQGREQGM